MESGHGNAALMYVCIHALALSLEYKEYATAKMRNSSVAYSFINGCSIYIEWFFISMGALRCLETSNNLRKLYMK